MGGPDRLPKKEAADSGNSAEREEKTKKGEGLKKSGARGKMGTRQEEPKEKKQNKRKQADGQQIAISDIIEQLEEPIVTITPTPYSCLFHCDSGNFSHTQYIA